MRYSYVTVASGLLAVVSSHGLVTSIQGANGVSMPGLSGKTYLIYLFNANRLVILTSLFKLPTALPVIAAATAAALKQIPVSFVTAS